MEGSFIVRDGQTPPYVRIPVSLFSLLGTNIPIKKREIDQTTIDRPVSALTLAIYGIIASHYNRKTGDCYPSMARVATLAGVRKEVVVLEVRVLCVTGHLSFQKGRRHGSLVHLYTLTDAPPARSTVGTMHGSQNDPTRFPNDESTVHRRNRNHSDSENQEREPAKTLARGVRMRMGDRDRAWGDYVKAHSAPPPSEVALVDWWRGAGGVSNPNNGGA